MTGRALRLPPLNALRAFEVSARQFNFRLAAEELGVTQGAVAQQVRALEADLGIRLFDRLPRALALTDQGRSYANRLQRAFEAMTEATLALRPQPLRLTISVTPSFASKWLLPRLPEFTQAHPDIELHIVATQGLSNFKSDGVDIAVRQGRPPFGSDLNADLLFEQEIVAVCSPLLLGKLARAITPKSLGKYPLLDDAHNLWPEYSERVLKRPLSAASKRVGFNQTALAIDAALAGQGVALASRCLVESDLAAGRLVLAFEAVMRSSGSYYVLVPRKSRLPKATAWVHDWLLSHKSSE